MKNTQTNSTHWRSALATLIAALGFLLVLGTAGASDCDLIPMSQILRQGCIGLGMLAGGLWLGGYLS